MFPITLVGAGIGCGRYIDTIGECPVCGEVGRVFCATCHCCLDCCECREYEEEY